MVLPQIPLPIVIFIPLFFIALILFTNVRYDFTPIDYLNDGITIASLIIGFVFLYAMQKYDTMDANFQVVVKNIIFLTDVSLKYDPSLICYLIQYLENFLSFNNTGYPIIIFEDKLLPLISDQNLIFRIRESVSILENISNQRITMANLIAAPIWYVVFFISFLLTIILPMNSDITFKPNAIILILLIWVPVVVIYVLYLAVLDDLNTAITNLIDDLQKIIKKEGINCCNIIGTTQNNCGINNKNK